MKSLRPVKLDSTRTFLGLDFSGAGAGAEIQEEVRKRKSRSGRANRPQLTRCAMNLRSSTIGPLQDIPRSFLIRNGALSNKPQFCLTVADFRTKRFRLDSSQEG